MAKQRLGKPLTWDDLADLYDRAKGGRKARTLPMDEIFKWAEQQPEKFKVAGDGTIRLITDYK